jgi:hypothetical protein
MISISYLDPVALLMAALFSFQPHNTPWESRFVKLHKDGSLKYIPDEKGNIIPDFSRVGYYDGDKDIPDVPVIKTISPGSSEAHRRRAH